MRTSLGIAAILTCTVGVLSCQPGPGPQVPSGVVRTYVDQALDTMRRYALRSDSVDWERLRRGTYSRALEATRPEEAHAALRWAVEQLGDRHSFLSDPSSSSDAMTVRPSPVPEGRRVADNLGYIRVPWFMGPNPSQFAAQIDSAARAAGGSAMCGWVVDLRDNVGGNMWPMLAGLRPILGPEPIGAFRDAAGIDTEWHYSEDGSYQTQWTATGEPYVAVLTNERTASSGEAVAVAFRGRARTRSFGMPTSGLSTANGRFPLSDGSTLYLTTSVDVDRNGVPYGGPIVPEEVTNADDTEARATAWLEQHCMRPTSG